MSKLTEFIHGLLYDEAFAHLDRAFPCMEFRRGRGQWESSFHLDGSPSRKNNKQKVTSKFRGYMHQWDEDERDVDYLTVVMEQEGISKPYEAVKLLCQRLGIEAPTMENSESYERWKRYQNAKFKYQKDFTKALFDTEGSQVLAYLKNERGYKEDFIRWAGFGYISEAKAKQIKKDNDINDYLKHTKKDYFLPSGAGTTHTLTIPFYSDGKLYGFKFRNISGSGNSKYKNTPYMPIGSMFFGLTGFNFTGSKVKDRDIILVEGELDALHAQYLGFDNVVAIGGSTPKEEALELAKKKGVRRVTLVFDKDNFTTSAERSEREEAYQKKVLDTINTISKNGLKSIVADLPQNDNGEKVDTDSYLNSFSSDEEAKEAFQNVLNEGAFEGLYRLFLRLDNAEKEVKEQDGERRIAYKDLNNLVIDVLEDTETYLHDPIDRRLVYDRLEYETGRGIRAKDIEELQFRREEERNKRIREAKLQRLTSQTKDLLEKGSQDEAIKLIKREIEVIDETAKRERYEGLLHTPTKNELLRRFREKPEGVKTGYVFYNPSLKSSPDYEPEELILPSGAISLICASTSHGKSKMLQNLALKAVKDSSDDETVLYFSFEEDADSVTMQMLNNYQGQDIAYNNLRRISEYYKMDNPDIDKAKFHKVDKAIFKQKEEEFFKLIEEGRIRIYYEDLDSSDLVDAIRYISRRLKTKIVFIDFIQLLNKESSSRKERHIEMKDIVNDLKNLAIDLQVPIVMAAQLNREAISFEDMSNQSIAEAADIERLANVVLCLWNSAFNSIKGAKKTAGSKASEEEKRLKDLGFKVGTPGSMYCKLTKYRGGAVNSEAVLQFNGNTGRITQGDIIDNNKSRIL